MNQPADAPPNSPPSPATALPAPKTGRRWNPASVALIVLAWLVLHIGCLFSPGLLDDVDSIYIEIAREMLVRHDLVTPYIDGIRFFDKPPLMYWLAAGSMHVFGAHAWAARLPLALLTLALFLATYALGLRLFAETSPAAHPDRGALYAALALATSIGPFLYTRFFIPDILLALWLTLAVHLFLIALSRASVRDRPARSSLLPMLGFAAITALNVLSKGLIGLVFPLGFVLLYLALTRNLRLIPRLYPVAATSAFLAIAAPWHILAALRNPAISLPPGLGLPAHAGWAWFYLYNEHIARFLSLRIPHDYGQVPIPLFWLLAGLWLFPWVAFLPAAAAQHIRDLRLPLDEAPRTREAALALLLWTALVLGFFTVSARQEYYSLPALPALALMIGGLLARADRNVIATDNAARRSVCRSTLWFLLPLGSLAVAIAAFFAFTAPDPPPGADISTLLAGGASDYNLSLGHIFDLTGSAMGLFRAPLALFALSMVLIGPLTFLLRRTGRTVAANLTLAASAALLLLSVHAGLTRFYPILGSESLANAILTQQQSHPQPPNASPDLILIDGELTAGSTLLFYTRQPVHLVEGRMNGPWFGAFWPDVPPIFETEATLRQLWSSPHRVFLLTYHPQARTRDLTPLAPTRTLASAGGKSILTNRQ